MMILALWVKNIFAGSKGGCVRETPRGYQNGYPLSFGLSFDSLDEDYTILSTIHSAKGQEWRIVRILNVVDGCIPSDMATRTPEEIEEERRLLYVAMTRAKDELDLIVPQRFYTFHQSKVGDQHVYACRSRFIPDGIMSSFDARSWAERVEVAHRPARNGATTDVAARLRRMWR